MSVSNLPAMVVHSLKPPNCCADDVAHDEQMQRGVCIAASQLNFVLRTCQLCMGPHASSLASPCAPGSGAGIAPGRTDTLCVSALVAGSVIQPLKDAPDGDGAVLKPSFASGNSAAHPTSPQVFSAPGDDSVTCGTCHVVNGVAHCEGRPAAGALASWKAVHLSSSAAAAGA